MSIGELNIVYREVGFLICCLVRTLYILTKLKIEVWWFMVF